MKSVIKSTEQEELEKFYNVKFFELSFTWNIASMLHGAYILFENKKEMLKLKKTQEGMFERKHAKTF